MKSLYPYLYTVRYRRYRDTGASPPHTNVCLITVFIHSRTFFGRSACTHHAPQALFFMAKSGLAYQSVLLVVALLFLPIVNELHYSGELLHTSESVALGLQQKTFAIPHRIHHKHKAPYAHGHDVALKLILLICCSFLNVEK